MLLPNLFLIGTQKGGSTSLFTYLEQHPEINSYGNLKEANVFNANSEKGARERLAALPVTGQDCQYRLDGSVNYSRYPRISSCAENIHAICRGAEVRFIYILRNPIDRLLSNYFWNVNHFGETRSIEQAVEMEAQYIDTGRYDFQIQQYLQYFDRSQFYFLRFDDFARDPRSEVKKIFAWLKLEPLIDLEVRKQRGKTEREQIRKPRMALLNWIIWKFHPLRALINRVFPQKFIRQAAKWLTKAQPGESLREEYKQELLDQHFRDSICRTEKITGLDLSDWLHSGEKKHKKTNANSSGTDATLPEYSS
ncbi:sulfotransferase [Microbulbifer bruguierae]|uniref:Sulfotransferase n=1 Tax=Microbulbifer bruguierae TaxID=3029061 RepID=A0ABY8NBF9_9GAMM|nr:sulfotransferase [Microbulbifer bruguierae]WGL15744.1 sulfotransferase [Microbulbifer bruguierae]